VTPIVVILVVAFLAWRYRKMLGLDQRWDRHGRVYTEELASKLGWTTGQKVDRKPTAPARPPFQSQAHRRSLLPTPDSSRLPVAVATGIVVATVVVALDIQGFSFLSLLVGMVVGPLAGGVFTRTRWWLLVAPLIAVVVGAGQGMGLWIVAGAVAAIAYAGLRFDVASWLARLYSDSEQS